MASTLLEQLSQNFMVSRTALSNHNLLWQITTKHTRELIYSNIPSSSLFCGQNTLLIFLVWISLWILLCFCVLGMPHSWNFFCNLHLVRSYRWLTNHLCSFIVFKIQSINVFTIYKQQLFIDFKIQNNQSTILIIC